MGKRSAHPHPSPGLLGYSVGGTPGRTKKAMELEDPDPDHHKYFTRKTWGHWTVGSRGWAS